MGATSEAGGLVSTDHARSRADHTAHAAALRLAPAIPHRCEGRTAAMERMTAAAPWTLTHHQSSTRATGWESPWIGRIAGAARSARCRLSMSTCVHASRTVMRTTRCGRWRR